jgi:hypothetical protein
VTSSIWLQRMSMRSLRLDKSITRRTSQERAAGADGGVDRPGLTRGLHSIFHDGSLLTRGPWAPEPSRRN